MKRRPKKEEPEEILTCSINSLVVGSWYALVDVMRATTPELAPIIVSLVWILKSPGVDWYVPVVLLSVSSLVTAISVEYTGVSSWWEIACVPSWPLVTISVVDSVPF